MVVLVLVWGTLSVGAIPDRRFPVQCWAKFFISQLDAIYLYWYTITFYVQLI